VQNKNTSRKEAKVNSFRIFISYGKNKQLAEYLQKVFGVRVIYHHHHHHHQRMCSGYELQNVDMMQYYG